MPRHAAASFVEEMSRFVTDDLSLDAVRTSLIADVTAERDRLISSGEASPRWTRSANGEEGTPETSLRVGGSIVYNFGQISEVVAFALELCQTKSPAHSGAYRNAWTVLVGGQVWTGDLEDLPFDTEVTIVNPAPYARKIDVGAMPKMSVPSGIIEAVRQTIFRKYPTITVWRKFINLSGSAGGFETPYILKDGAARRLAKRDMRSAAYRRGQDYLARRKDLAPGQPITYPALVISDPAYSSSES